MAINLTFPLGKNKDNIKNLVFSILTKEYPLKIIDLTNFIRKRYGKSVTFQAVRKAILQLVDEKVLERREHKFQINKKWVLESKKTLDQLYSDLNKEKIHPTGIDSIQGNVSVFAFDSLNDLMKFWEDLIDDWFETFKLGDPNINCYQGAHGWEGLMHPDRERIMMSRLKEKGIKSFAFSTGNTSLDKYVWKFYKSIGLKVGLHPSTTTFDRGYYVVTYGETIIQTQYPPTIIKLLDKFFKKSKSIDHLNLKELSEIINKKIKIKLTVIKNLEMAKQINKSIINQIKESKL
ncbi:hypothetical protein HN587_05450 [Candidatus Woesearchaeota archaeon]|jgi:hypothetical protein|nr:hypothetical protein [Candidatus Woesearchaeota archaeon]